jgi:hypothetical protein
MTNQEQKEYLERVFKNGWPSEYIPPASPVPHIDKKPSKKYVKLRRRQQNLSRKINRKK